MKLRILCILFAALLLLTGCATGGGVETTDGALMSGEVTTESVTTGGSLENEGTTEENVTTGDVTTEESSTTPELLVLPRPYIDIEFGKDGTDSDRIGTVDCVVANPMNGDVKTGTLKHDGKSYQTPYFDITRAGGVLRLEYRDLTDMYDLYEDLMGGFAMEAFLVNRNARNSDSGEECLIASTQSGGYNLTTLKGRYTASVHTDGSYKNAKMETAYSTEELTHLVNVYDPSAGTVSLYVNGELANRSDAKGMLGLASGEAYRTIVIGGDINSSGNTDIHCASLAITDFKLYRTSLSETEASALYNIARSKLTGEPCDYEVVEGDSQLGVTDAIFESAFDSFATDIYQPNTKLENPPTILQYADASVQSLSAQETRPATVVFGVKVNSDGTLSATTRDGTVIGAMRDVIKSLNKKMIPAFQFETEAEGKAIAAFTKENFLADCFLICSDGALLKKIADMTYAARPLLQISEPQSKGGYDMEAVRLAVSKLGGKTVLLSAEYLTPELIVALRTRAISVVALLPLNADVAQIHNAVHCGISGIVTEDYTDVISYYETVTNRTLCITPLVVAHRGDPESHPDNMLRSLISGANSGATSIELDVWLTKDNHLVLNHDSKTTHFNQQLSCKDSTRAQLEALTYTGAHAQAGDKIAFLDEVFKVFSKDYRDKLLLIEVKDAREVTVDRIVALAKEYKMESNIVLIGMNHLISNYVYEKYADDGITANMNQTYLVKKENPSMSLLLGTLESTMLHSSCFTTHAQEHPEFMKGIYHRLIKYSTWTSTTAQSTLENYLCGVVEYTTNFPHLIDDFYRYLKIEISDSGQVKVIGVTYAGETVNLTGHATLVVLDGNITYSGGKISGSGTYAFRVSCDIEGVENSNYDLYTPALTQ